MFPSLSLTLLNNMGCLATTTTLARLVVFSTLFIVLKMFKVKLLVVGPCKSGKTALSNFLSDATETSGGEYFPTQGVRILEFESSPLSINGRNMIAEIELWDCSGSEKFESCWPAMVRDANGVVFIFTPEQATDRELDKFYAHFVHLPGLRETQCMAFALRRPKGMHTDSKHLSSAFARMVIVEANLEEDGEAIRMEFTRFLHRLLATLHEKRDQEELNIINS